LNNKGVDLMQREAKIRNQQTASNCNR